MAVSKHPSITPETSSGEGLDEEQSSRGEAKWKRFHPFRVVRKIFRRRVKRQGTPEVQDTSKKSWSTSELLCVQEDTPSNYEAPAPPYKIGLSVSHDSIFSPDNGSGSVKSEELSRPQGSSLSVQHAGIKNMFKDELYTRVRARRDSDDDDIGLPHSPCTSPTTVDVLTQGLKEKSAKSQITCSAGSLISMGSSENDDDSAAQLSSGHSSRMSLLDRRSIDSEVDVDMNQSVPLNHKAAHHKIAVRPKRKYGLPQRRLKQLAASAMGTLPSTPELIEDNGKSLSKLETVEVYESASVSVKSTERISNNNNSQSEDHDIIKSESAVSCQIFNSKYERQVFQLKQDISENLVMECKNEALKCDTGELSVTCHLSELTSNVIKSSNINEVHDHGQEMSSKMSTKEKCNSVQKLNDTASVSSSKGVITSTMESSNISTNIKCSKKEFESGQESVIREKNLQKLDVTALRVSAMIKSIEKPEIFYHHEPSYSLEGDSESKIIVSGAVDVAGVKISDKRTLDSEFVLDPESLLCKESHIEIESLKNSLQLNSQKGTSPLSEFIGVSNSNLTPGIVPKELESGCLNSESKSSNICEGNIKSSISQSYNSDSEWLKMQQFHSVVTEKQSPSFSICSASTEEESIMSEKNVSVLSPEGSVKEEESKVFISYEKVDDNLSQSSEVDKENCNVHEIISIPTFCSMSSKQLTQANEDKKQFVSSIDICADTLKSPMSEMTIHSLISQVTSCKNTEDKVVISVNPEENKVGVNEKKQSLCEQHSTEKKVCSSEILVKSDSSVSTSTTISGTTLEPEGRIKSCSFDNMSSSKASKVQKRVSVEIVPFSQRVKERKYQPVIYSRDEVYDTSKAKSNVVIERKLSDRKLSAGKGASQVKGNNRHSFSGVISETHKKEEEFKNSQQLSRDEKPSVPVQIRIHKDKPSVVSSSKPPVQKVSNASYTDKLQQLETPKQLKPHLKVQEKSDSRSGKSGEISEITANEASIKQWEVKIHPAPKLKNEISPSTQRKVEHKSKECITFQEEQYSLHDKSEEIKHKLERVVHETISSVASAVSKKPLEDLEALQNQTSQNNLKSGRENPSPTEMEPELFRVFARRSIKQRTLEKTDTEHTGDTKTSEICSSDDMLLSDVEKCQENHQIINVSDNSTVIKISEHLEGYREKSPDIVKKKSKSFSEKEKLEKQKTIPFSAQATSLNRWQISQTPEIPVPVQETVHRRQRLASVPDIPVILPPPHVDTTLTEMSVQNGICKENDSPVLNKTDGLHRASSLSISTSGVLNGSSNSSIIDSLKVKENPDILGKDSPTPQWLQLAQQRREMREQRERLLLGSSTNSFVLESSGKPSRSSKVWDMVNNFQKLQMT